MKKLPTNLCLMVIITGIFLVGCDNAPGPLEGKWVLVGPMRLTIIFRDGEVETEGITEKASYKIDGNSILVTGESGLDKGMTYRYQLINKNTAKSPLGIMRKIN